MGPGSLPLAAHYDALYAASARGDAATAHAAFLALVGLGPRRTVSAVPTTPPPARAPLVRYDRPRRVDLLALTHGGRDVAKFEDLTAPQAEALTARLRAAGLRVVRTGPYTKRFDVALSTDGVPGYYAVIASRGREADAVAEAERDRGPEGTRRAGLALGYPPCCIDRFVAVAAGSAAQSEGINEAALRASVGAGVLPWTLNPLAQDAPVGFTPCGPACPAARAFAARVLAAVERAEPGATARLRTVLSRPVLFFRYGVFYALDGAEAPGVTVPAARYVRAVPHGLGPPGPLDAWQHDELGAPLAAGDTVSLGPDALTVTRMGDIVARWTLSDPHIPRLLRFHDTGALTA